MTEADFLACACRSRSEVGRVGVDSSLRPWPRLDAWLSAPSGLPISLFAHFLEGIYGLQAGKAGSFPPYAPLALISHAEKGGGNACMAVYG